MVGNSKGRFSGRNVVEHGPHKGKSAAMILAEMERLSSERLAVEAQLYSGIKSGDVWGANLPSHIAETLERRDAFLYLELCELARAYEGLTGKVSPWGRGVGGSFGVNDGGSFWVEDGKEEAAEYEADDGGMGADDVADLLEIAKELNAAKRRGKLVTVGDVIRGLNRVGRGEIFSEESATCKKCGCDFMGMAIAPRKEGGESKKFRPEFCEPCDRLRRDEERRCKKCGGLDVYLSVAPIPAGDGSEKTMFRRMTICPICEPEGKKKEVQAVWAAKNRERLLESLPPYVRNSKRDLFPDIGGSDAVVGHDFFSGSCVLIFGKSRTGKSRTAAELLVSVAASGKVAKWFSCDTLSPKLRGDAKGRGEKIEQLQSTFCVAFDGFDDVLTSPAVADAYRRIFRARRAYGLPTVVTTRLTPREFLEYATARKLPPHGREAVAEILDILREDFTRYELRTERERKIGATQSDAWR